MLRWWCNVTILDNKLMDEGVRALQRRLPFGWKVDLVRGPKTAREIDGHLRVTAPDRQVARLPVETRRRLEPRGVLELAAKYSRAPGNGPSLVIAPYLSPAVRERLQEAGLAFVDLTGNIRVELSRPGLFISSRGADVDPNRKARPSRSLRGAKAGRIVRALVDFKEPRRVRELARQANVDPGYVSRVLALLDREALIDRQGRGRIAKVDWPRLLRRWAEEAPLESRGTQATCLEPRGIAVLLSKLEQLDIQYAITGTLAASKVAPLTPPRLAMIYVENLERAMTDLGLRAAESGANVLLVEPGDTVVFTGAITEDGLSRVALSQAVVDLLTSPGRGPAEAEELIDWMVKNEEAWRG